METDDERRRRRGVIALRDVEDGLAGVSAGRNDDSLRAGPRSLSRDGCGQAESEEHREISQKVKRPDARRRRLAHAAGAPSSFTRRNVSPRTVHERREALPD
jgi:hypothetical protein